MSVFRIWYPDSSEIALHRDEARKFTQSVLGIFEDLSFVNSSKLIMSVKAISKSFSDASASERFSASTESASGDRGEVGMVRSSVLFWSMKSHVET